MGAWYVWGERGGSDMRGVHRGKRFVMPFEYSCLLRFLLLVDRKKFVMMATVVCVVYPEFFYLIEKRTLLTRTHRIYCRHFSLSL